MANTFSCLNIHCVFSTPNNVFRLMFENALQGYGAFSVGISQVRFITSSSSSNIIGRQLALKRRLTF